MSAFFDVNRYSYPNVNSVIRVIASVHLAFAAYYDMRYIHLPANVLPAALNYGWKFKYLTFWNECVEAIYFCISVVDDILLRRSEDEKTSLKSFRDYMFTVIVFPLSWFVGIVFWGLYAVDRELVLPKVVDPYFPVWLNHSVHTFVIIYSSLEMITSYHKPSSLSMSLPGLWGFVLVYLGWIHVVYAKSGFWVYPILSKLTLPYRIVFFTGAFIGITSFFVFGRYANDAIWKKRIQIPDKKL